MSVSHYCEMKDVKGINSQREYDSTSKPSISQVKDFIEDVADMMDKRLLVKKFTVPITSGSNTLSYLRKICAWGAAAMAEESTHTSQSQTKASIKPRYVRLWGKYEAEMKRIEANPEILDDSGAWGEVGKFASYSEQNTTDESTEARFEIGETF